MDLMSSKETATTLGVPPETLRYWRWRNEGPRSFKIGAHVVYERADVLAWIATRKAATARGGLQTA